jgi:hypothetical protein
MSEGTVRQLCRIYKDGEINALDEDRIVRPSVVSDEQNFVTDGASKFQNFSVNFHKFRALFYMRFSQSG